MATTALQFATALGEVADQFAGTVSVSENGETLHLFASIPSTTLAQVLAKIPRSKVDGDDV
ncbi:MAG: hypothetical protein LBE05_05795 [Microbacterium sp.]|nr:hypothetical protein [Microbacterium sp.]